MNLPRAGAVCLTRFWSIIVSGGGGYYAVTPERCFGDSTRQVEERVVYDRRTSVTVDDADVSAESVLPQYRVRRTRKLNSHLIATVGR